MLRWPERRLAAPRWKKGQPAQSTTGVARASWIQPFQAMGQGVLSPNRWPPISRAKTGAVRAAPIQKRRVKSTSSGLGPWSRLTRSGSRAMPQIGQEPGPSWRISGCMGQV